MARDDESVLDAAERTDRLVNLLEQQRDCYAELKRLAQRQRRLISDQDPESLLKVLAERQRLVDRLAELNRSLQPFRQEWASAYSQMMGERRQYVRRVLDDINMLLGSILITDAEDGRLLSLSKEGVRSGMATAAIGRFANSAYAAQALRTAGLGAANCEA
jgi:hypothetical protein